MQLTDWLTEYWHNMFLRNFDKYLPDYTALRLQYGHFHSYRLQNFKSQVGHEKIKDSEEKDRNNFLNLS
jgi:hypothetical protein